MNNLAHGLEMSSECLLPQVFEYPPYQNQSLAYLRGKGSTFSPPNMDPSGACGACGGCLSMWVSAIHGRMPDSTKDFCVTSKLKEI